MDLKGPQAGESGSSEPRLAELKQAFTAKWKHEHIPPVLALLPWLPMQLRMNLNVLSFTCLMLQPFTCSQLTFIAQQPVGARLVL